MFDIAVITVLLIAIVGVVIYIEHKKANKPHADTYKRYKVDENRKSVFLESLDKKDSTKTEVKETPSSKKESTVSLNKTVKEPLEIKKENVSEDITASIKEIPLKKENVVSIALPEADYSKFDHSRLLEMGLSEDEVRELIAELIAQIETELPLIEKTIDPLDIENMSEHLHYIKGSATNLGSGGISDLLIDFYTYVQKDKEIAIIEAYFKHLKSYYKELKEQY